MPVRFQVEPDFYDHPKTAGMSDAAFSLWVRAGSYSAAKLTDGFVSEDVLVHTLRAATQVADELVDRGLWRRRRGGWIFHKWVDHHNFTKQGVREHNEAEAKRKREERKRRSAQVRGLNVRADVQGDVDRTPGGLRPESNTVGVGVKSSSGTFKGGSLETYENDHPPPKINDPPKGDPANPRCAEHAHVPADQRGPNCGRCATVREQLDRHGKAADFEQVMITRRCKLCDADGWRYEADSRVPVTPYIRCDHRPLRSVG